MEGGDGVDTAEVNGGNGSETFTITANGTRVRFDRISPAPFTLDIGTTENLVLNANGGDDVITAGNGLANLIKLTIDGGYDVITAIGVENEILGGADVQGEGRGADAVETHARAVGRDSERFRAVAAVARIPDHAIVAGFAEHLAAIAANQHVVARAVEQQVVAAFAVEGVVARTVEQQVVARAAGQNVVARATEQMGGWQGPVCFIHRNRVVAAVAEHLNHARVGDGRGAASNRHGAAIHENLSRCVAARHDHVIRVVAGYRQHSGTGRKGRFDRRFSHDLNPHKGLA